MIAGTGAVRHRRTAVLGAIVVAAASLTSACAAGRLAQTSDQRPTIDGVNAQAGDIAIRNLSIEAPTTGTYFPTGSALRLDAVFVNNGTADDQLTDISSTSVTGWGAYSSITDGDQVVAAAAASAAGSESATPSSATSGSATSSAPHAILTVGIPNGSRTSFGVPVATGSLLVLGTKARIYPGSTVTMTLTFARAGTVTVPVPVQITTDPTQATVEAPSGTGDDN